MVSGGFYRENKQEKADLAALKALIDAIEGKLDDAGFGLSALVGEINANEVKIDTVDTVADAIKAKTDNLPATPANEATSLAIKARTDNLPASPANETTVNAIKTQTNKLAGVTGSGVHVHTNNLLMQIVLEWTPLAARRKVHSIWLDFVNLTQSTVYQLSCRIDGINYRVFDSNVAAPWTPAMDDGVLIAVNAAIDTDFKLEIQSQVLEGADRNVPYRVICEDM